MPSNAPPRYPPNDQLRNLLLLTLYGSPPLKRSVLLARLADRVGLSPADRERTFKDYDGVKESSSDNEVWGTLVSNEFDRLVANGLADREGRGYWKLTSEGSRAAESLSPQTPNAPPVDVEGRPLDDTVRSLAERVSFASFRFLRDSSIARTVKDAAGHVCAVCDRPGIPLADGRLYAEAHHVHPLSSGGPDAVDNMVCVCPSCHAALDYLAMPLPDDIRQRVPTLSAEAVEYHNARARSDWQPPQPAR